MTLLAGPFAAAAALLLVGGALKVVRPDETAIALRQAGLGVGRHGVRLAATGEAVLAATALATGWPAAVVAVATSYAGFAAFVAWALVRRLPLASCGCLGAIDTPPTPLHVALNLAAAGVAAAGAATGVPPLDEMLAGQPLGGVPFVALVALTTWLAVVAMSELPRTLALRRSS